MKRFFIRLMSLLLLILPFAGCASEKPESEKKDCSLYLDIAFDSNLFFDRYDVEVYVDETRAGSIKHGDAFSVLLTVKEGKHTVYFYKQNEHSVKGSQNIDLKDDATFRCTIKTHGSSIDIKDYEMLETIEGAAIKVPDVKGKVLQEAIDTLEDLGFKQIDYETDNDSSVWDRNNWIVVKQNITTGSEIDKNTKILLTVTPMSDYFAQKFSGQSVTTAMKTAKSLGYQVIYIKDLTGSTDYTSEFQKMSEEETSRYTVDHAEDVSNEIGKKICFYTDYERQASFSKESAKRAAVTALTNYFAMDVFDSDGDVDPSKFHTYADTSGNTDDYYLRVLSDGTWTVIDDHTIHCEELRLKNSWDTIFLFNLDVSFDGTVYKISNVIDAKGTNASNTQTYPDSDPSYTVTPDMIDTDRSDASSLSVPSTGSIQDFMEYIRTMVSDESTVIELIDSVVYVKMYYDGMAALATNAKDYGGEDLESWNRMTEMVKQLSSDIRTLTYAAKVSDYHIVASLMNDLNKEMFLYAAFDGETVADYVNE